MEDNPDQPNTQDNKYPSSSDPIISSILLIHSANTPKKPANNHKTTLRFKHHKSARTRQKTPQQPPITTKTIFNGQTLLTTTDVLVDLEIGDDLEVAVDIEIGGNQRERPTP